MQPTPTNRFRFNQSRFLPPDHYLESKELLEELLNSIENRTHRQLVFTWFSSPEITLDKLSTIIKVSKQRVAQIIQQDLPIILSKVLNIPIGKLVPEDLIKGHKFAYKKQPWMDKIRQVLFGLWNSLPDHLRFNPFFVALC